LGSPRTDADDTGNKHSPNKQLDVPLFLLMQNKEDATKWQLPQGPVEPEETLRQVKNWSSSTSELFSFVHEFCSHFMYIYICRINERSPDVCVFLTFSFRQQRGL
jgi:hypothetical protein